MSFEYTVSVTRHNGSHFGRGFDVRTDAERYFNDMASSDLYANVSLWDAVDNKLDEWVPDEAEEDDDRPLVLCPECGNPMDEGLAPNHNFNEDYCDKCKIAIPVQRIPQWTTEDFKPGDVLEFRHCHKRDGKDIVEIRTALVTLVNYAPGYVSYIGHCADGRIPSGSGAFNPSNVGGRYGFYTAVRKIGRASLPMQHYQGPRQGDPGYDLMC